MGHVACMVQMRNAYKTLFEKAERKRILGRSRHRWYYNMSWILRE
jgi:hypothetical protein